MGGPAAVVSTFEVVTWNDLGEEPPVMMQAPLRGLEGKTHFWMGKDSQFYIVLRLIISKAGTFRAGYCSNEDVPNRSLTASRFFNKCVGLKIM